MPLQSTLGKLQRKALVFVGRAVVEGHRYKVAAISVELHEGLAGLLRSSLPGGAGKIPTATREARPMTPLPGGAHHEEDGDWGRRRRNVRISRGQEVVRKRV
ncbi:MAG: hypothetical protein H5T95_13940 [Firmicutes bacterium]|nr:hypothetical protein [Bacillota bacterium]